MIFPVSRRTILGALLATPLPLPAAPGLRAADLRVLPEQASGDALLEYLLGFAKDVTARRRERLRRLRTDDDVRAWQETNRDAFRKCIGGLWSERTPLRPRLRACSTGPGYQVRKIIFESLPEFYGTRWAAHRTRSMGRAGGVDLKSTLPVQAHSRMRKWV